MASRLLSFISLFLVSLSSATTLTTNRTCIVTPAPNGTDSAPAIIEAFESCGHNEWPSRGTVVFQNTTYTVASVMNTTGLSNLDVDLRGTLLWDNSDLPYWLNNSIPVGYQNQTSAWRFGGDNITFLGHGYGTLDGAGQIWYDFANGTNNYPNRPHQLTIASTYNSYFSGLRFVQSQMWTMTIIHAQHILLEDIYINSTDTERGVGFEFSSLNTDGADTIYADDVTFRRWTVDNGDDSISVKANSTNILVEDCVFWTGLGVAVGSIGQYDGVHETIENVTARNISVNNMRYGAYIKTWTGNPTGYPPNGGGGGLGYAANITFTNFTLNNVSGIYAITQCTSYNSASGNCDTSLFNLRDITLSNWTGTTTSDVIAAIQCSGASPCTGMRIENVEGIVDTVNGTKPANYLCGGVGESVGWNCTGGLWEENSR